MVSVLQFFESRREEGGILEGGGVSVCSFPFYTLELISVNTPHGDLDVFVKMSVTFFFKPVLGIKLKFFVLI